MWARYFHQFFGKSFLLTFLFDIPCDLLQGSLASKNMFKKVSFAMVLSPTRPYAGLGISSIGGYVMLLMGFVLFHG